MTMFAYAPSFIDSKVLPYRHLPPQYQRFHAPMWRSVVVCEECRSITQYEDAHPVDPCPLCGNRDRRKEYSARWVEHSRVSNVRWWNPFSWRRPDTVSGEWGLKDLPPMTFDASGLNIADMRQPIRPPTDTLREAIKAVDALAVFAAIHGQTAPNPALVETMRWLESLAGVESCR